MTEIEAKVKYVKLARSLRTYGVSFFLVKVSGKTILFNKKIIYPQKKWKKKIKPEVLFELNYLKREKQILEWVEMKSEPFIS